MTVMVIVMVLVIVKAVVEVVLVEVLVDLVLVVVDAAWRISRVVTECVVGQVLDAAP